MKHFPFSVLGFFFFPVWTCAHLMCVTEFRCASDSVSLASSTNSNYYNLSTFSSAKILSLVESALMKISHIDPTFLKYFTFWSLGFFVNSHLLQEEAKSRQYLRIEQYVIRSHFIAMDLNNVMEYQSSSWYRTWSIYICMSIFWLLSVSYMYDMNFNLSPPHDDFYSALYPLMPSSQ